MPYTFRHGDRPLEGLTVQRAVGRGGFGEVYYALSDSGKQIALKYLRENPEIELRGIGHVMNLKSPHLITIYDVRRGTVGEPFVIMEYVGGPSLRELLTAEPNGLGPQKAAYFLDGIARGLAYLHDRGIVHRDLKPANIFCDDGYVKIGDYGLSKHISVSKHSGQTVSVGTVHYMAPEIGSGSYTKAIDIYALGVILYEMLTGRLPFTGSSMGEVLMRHLSDPPNLTDIPEPFATVIAKALAKDPHERYQDADEMADALRQSGDISASIAAFDASTLNNVPRQPEVADGAPTVTTPPPVPPPPPLDARAPARPGHQRDDLAHKLQQKVDRLSHKFAQKSEKLGRKYGWHQANQGAGHVRGAGWSRFDIMDTPERKRQTIVLLAVIVAVAVGLALLQGGAYKEQTAAALAFCLAAGTFGPLLTYFRFLRRSLARSPLWDRLAYAGITAACLIPAFGIASDLPGDALARMMIAPLAVLFVCDWTKRIEAGQLGEIKGGQAVGPAVVGFIVANFVGGLGLAAACVCAMMSLLTQAGAAMWPTTTRAGGTGKRGRPEPFAAGPPPAAPPGASPAGVAPPGALGRSAMAASDPPVARVPRSRFVRTVFGILSTLAVAGSLGAFFVLAISPPSCVDDCSGLLFATLAGFVWLPFLLSKALYRYKMPLWRATLRPLIISASLCLVAGMIALLAFQPLQGDDLAGTIFGLVFGGVIALVALGVRGRRSCAGARRGTSASGPSAEDDAEAPVVIDAAAPSFVGRAANAGLSFFGKLLLLVGLALALGHDTLIERLQPVLIRNDISVGLIENGPPPQLLLGLPLLGSLLLIVARRPAGGAHVLRGALGCALALWAAIMALGPAASALHELLVGDWSTVNWAAAAPPLAIVALPLTGAFLLLTWPRASRNQTVVV